MSEVVDWNAFMKTYENAAHAVKVKMIHSHLKHFELKPDWVSSKVWGEVLA